MNVRMIFAPRGNNVLANDDFDEKYPAVLKARVLSLDPRSAASESLLRIQIQGPMFCTKILRLGDGSAVRYDLEGKAGAIAYIDSPDEFTFDENKFCLLVVERGPSGSAQEVTGIGLILARPKPENEEYIRLGVWTQRHLIGETRQWKEEDLALNMEEKTVFLI